MIVGCINGDPDKPIGLGTIPNANTISPVCSRNKHTSVIRTAGNNEMVFDDGRSESGRRACGPGRSGEY
jgi:type VI secretion system secreted protein VgrG